MTLEIRDVQNKVAEITAEGQFFELCQREVDGENYTVFTHAPVTSIDILQQARTHADKEFLVYQGRRYTYTTFFAAVDRLAAQLQAMGVVPGDRLAIAMRNCPEWAISFAAGTLIGAVVVPVNSWGKSEELLYVLKDAGASILIADAQRAQLLQNTDLAITRILVGANDADGSGHFSSDWARFDKLIASEPAAPLQIYQADANDHCMILYTSGSTGFPKGVVHRHVAICQALFNMMYLGMLVGSLEGFMEFKGGATVETPLLTVPLFHATGLIAGIYLPMYTGQKVVIMYKWNSEEALKLIEQERVTSFTSVPAIIQDLFSHPDYDNYDTQSLIRVSGGGAAMPTGLPELIQSKCGKVSRSTGYAMTESMAVCSAMSGCLFDLKPYSGGLLSPIMEVRTVQENGVVLASGQTGELEMRGITCTHGYWKKDAENAKTFRDGHWMKTGDIGYLDEDDFIIISGRSKEIVIRGGENIYPGEIENVAYALSEVHECVVFGEPDAAMGEELVMVVYLSRGSSLSEAQLRESLSQRLAAYKIPRTIVFVKQALPRNVSEKIYKLAVKEQFLAGQLS